ncbi:hypothetical protein VTO73DRAFT_12199 [Trametes versicolor]
MPNRSLYYRFAGTSLRSVPPCAAAALLWHPSTPAGDHGTTSLGPAPPPAMTTVLRALVGGLLGRHAPSARRCDVLDSKERFSGQPPTASLSVLDLFLWMWSPSVVVFLFRMCKVRT